MHFLCINKYFWRRKAANDSDGHNIGHRAEDPAMVDMSSSHCATAACFTSGEPDNSKNRRRSSTTTTRANRSDFSKATTSSLFPNTRFTNHESIPGFPEAYSGFCAAYPKYGDTELAAAPIRDHEYPHLSRHACLDYSGFGLFSHAQINTTSSSRKSSFYFDISYKSAKPTELESAMRRRIMSFLNISDEDYSMVLTANKASAFKLLAESYPFQSNKRLVTVYDYESEAVNSMAESAARRGARVSTASFSWPGLRIHAAKLKRVLIQRKKKGRGLFVFPLQSAATGARYPYLWMSLAQDSGWHVVLDACGLGPKDMDSLGVSLIRPDFVVFSFFKVFGEDPSGFSGLLIKKTGGTAALDSSAIARSVGVVSIVPAVRPEDVSSAEFKLEESHSSISTTTTCAEVIESENEENNVGESGNGFEVECKCLDHHPGSELKPEEPHSSNSAPTNCTEIMEESVDGFEIECNCSDYHPGMEFKPEQPHSSNSAPTNFAEIMEDSGSGFEIECKCLDHADSMGLLLISSRLRYITNWLVIAMMKLRHPHSDDGHPLVRIYGPRVKFDRAPSVAFNLYDWKGEKVEPALVQKLADRSSISLSCGFLHNIWFSAKYEERKDGVLEKRTFATKAIDKKKESVDMGIHVVSASLGFLTNFEDAYRLWAFVAKFLDADFVEKERWRYMALNQKMIEV